MENSDKTQPSACIVLLTKRQAERGLFWHRMGILRVTLFMKRHRMLPIYFRTWPRALLQRPDCTCYPTCLKVRFIAIRTLFSQLRRFRHQRILADGLWLRVE